MRAAVLVLKSSQLELNNLLDASPIILAPPPLFLPIIVAYYRQYLYYPYLTLL